MSTSHLYEIPLSNLPPQVRGEFEKIKGINKPYPDSLVVYEYNPDFSAPRTNMWILSANSGPIFWRLSKGESEYPYRIPYDDWTHDFLPKLRAHTVLTIEIPLAEVVPTFEHLVRAVEELKHGERLLREGNYDGVIRSIRNILLNHLLTKTEVVETQDHKEMQRFLDDDLKRAIISNIPREAESEYKTVLHGIEGILRRLLQDHLSKFIHVDTQELSRMPLRADAEYLFLILTSIVRYLSGLSSPSPT